VNTTIDTRVLDLSVKLRDGGIGTLALAGRRERNGAENTVARNITKGLDETIGGTTRAGRVSRGILRGLRGGQDGSPVVLAVLEQVGEVRGYLTEGSDGTRSIVSILELPVSSMGVVRSNSRQGNTAEKLNAVNLDARGGEVVRSKSDLRGEVSIVELSDGRSLSSASAVGTLSTISPGLGPINEEGGSPRSGGRRNSKLSIGIRGDTEGLNLRVAR